MATLHRSTELGQDAKRAIRGQNRFAIRRRPLRELTIKRLLLGGRLADAGRLPRYAALFLMGGALIWAPIVGYLKTAPLKFTSSTSLILPGSGASASVNLNDIGQASSYANSAFSSQSISPTETYKRLLGADRILAAAADTLGVSQQALGSPRVDLVDQTSLIRVQMTGGTPEQAQERGDALLRAFFAELDALREDELIQREDSGLGAMDDYRASVAATRAEIEVLQQQTGLVSGDQYNALVAAKDDLAIRVNALEHNYEQSVQSVRAMEAVLEMTALRAVAMLRLGADAEYMKMAGDMASHAADLSDARSRFGPRHPAVAKASDSYNAARAAATRQAMAVTGLSASEVASFDHAPAGAHSDLMTELVRLENERVGLQAELFAKTARLTAEVSRLQELGPAAARLIDTQRDFAVAEAVFASAIARTQSSKSDVYASYPLVQVLENPSLPDGPSSPRRKIAIAAGVAATFMMLMGLALGWIRLALISRLLVAAKRPEAQV